MVLSKHNSPFSNSYTFRKVVKLAVGYNVLGIPVAMGVLHIFGGPLLSPMLGGLAMSFSSVCVVGNALRLRRLNLEK